MLTGETGAGKSILLDALALALGARGDAALVRHGAERRARSRPSSTPPPTIRLSRCSQTNDIDADGEIILRRVQTPTARRAPSSTTSRAASRCCKAIGALLVEIHGQHDDRALVEPAEHRALLDAFGGLEPDAADVAGRYARCARSRRRPRSSRRRSRRRAREADICAPRWRN